MQIFEDSQSWKVKYLWQSLYWVFQNFCKDLRSFFFEMYKLKIFKDLLRFCAHVASYLTPLDLSSSALPLHHNSFIWIGVDINREEVGVRKEGWQFRLFCSLIITKKYLKLIYFYLLLTSDCLFLIKTFTTVGASWKYIPTFFNVRNGQPTGALPQAPSISLKNMTTCKYTLQV